VLGRDVLVGRTDLQLVLPPGARVDLEIAAEAIHRAESANASGEWTRALIPARVALHVASRDFLPGDDAPWIDERRRWIADLRVRALDCVGTAGLGVGGTELAAAERSGRTLIELEPLRESGYRLLMQALAARGDSAQALIVYERLRRLLRDELGTTPSRATQALHRSLLAGSR
jgi:DNA-binding SARP family transcriptional activator